MAPGYGILDRTIYGRQEPFEDNLRLYFRRHVRTTPSAYQRAFSAAVKRPLHGKGSGQGNPGAEP
jgi:hypothetical protein